MNAAHLVSTPRTQHIELNISNDKEKETSTWTGPVLENCAQFTGKTAELTFSPKYSVLLNGIAAMNDNSGGDYGRPIGQGIGFLMVLTTPAVFAVKCLLGVPSVIGGVIATALVTPVYVTEKIARSVSQGIGGVLEPSEATKKRQEYTELFISRMMLLLDNFKTAKREEFKKNPESLICLAATVVAFLSRDLKKEELKAGDEILKKEDLEEMNEDAKKYFKKICLMKSCIRDLELSRHDEHAWDTLTTFIMALNTDNNDLQESQKEALRLLSKEGEEFSQMVLEDGYFIEAWNKKNS